MAQPSKVWEVSGRVLSGVIVALVVTGLAGIMSLYLRVGVIEASRFTTSDWVRERRELMREIPPPEVLIRLDRIEADIRDLERHHGGQ